MIQFSKPLILWEPLPAEDFSQLSDLLGGDAQLAGEVRAAVSVLHKGFTRTNSLHPWGIACIPLGHFLVFYRGEKQGFSWRQALQVIDLREAEYASAEILIEEVLPRHAEHLPRDERFMEALRDTAFLTCLAGGAQLRCLIDEKQQPLAEAVLAELLTGAVPAERLRFVSFIAGTGELPQVGFQFGFSCKAPQEDTFEGAFADFAAAPHALELRFNTMTFAQRVVRKLLPTLGLSVLLSMWNATERTVIETIGTAAGESQDLIAWELLRHNFTPKKFPMTQVEYDVLQKKATDYEAKRRQKLRARTVNTEMVELEEIAFTA